MEPDSYSVLRTGAGELTGAGCDDGLYIVLDHPEWLNQATRQPHQAAARFANRQDAHALNNAPFSLPVALP